MEIRAKVPPDGFRGYFFSNFFCKGAIIGTEMTDQFYNIKYPWHGDKHWLEATNHNYLKIGEYYTDQKLEEEIYYDTAPLFSNVFGDATDEITQDRQVFLDSDRDGFIEIDLPLLFERYVEQNSFWQDMPLCRTGYCDSVKELKKGLMVYSGQPIYFTEFIYDYRYAYSVKREATANLFPFLQNDFGAARKYFREKYGGGPLTAKQLNDLGSELRRYLRWVGEHPDEDVNDNIAFDPNLAFAPFSKTRHGRARLDCKLFADVAKLILGNIVDVNGNRIFSFNRIKVAYQKNAVGHEILLATAVADEKNHHIIISNDAVYSGLFVDVNEGLWKIATVAADEEDGKVAAFYDGAFSNTVSTLYFDYSPYTLSQKMVGQYADRYYLGFDVDMPDPFTQVDELVKRINDDSIIVGSYAPEWNKEIEVLIPLFVRRVRQLQRAPEENNEEIDKILDTAYELAIGYNRRLNFDGTDAKENAGKIDYYSSAVIQFLKGDKGDLVRAYEDHAAYNKGQELAVLLLGYLLLAKKGDNEVGKSWIASQIKQYVNRLSGKEIAKAFFPDPPNRFTGIVNMGREATMSAVAVVESFCSGKKLRDFYLALAKNGEGYRAYDFSYKFYSDALAKFEEGGITPPMALVIKTMFNLIKSDIEGREKTVQEMIEYYGEQLIASHSSRKAMLRVYLDLGWNDAADELADHLLDEKGIKSYVKSGDAEFMYDLGEALLRREGLTQRVKILLLEEGCLDPSYKRYIEHKQPYGNEHHAENVFRIGSLLYQNGHYATAALFFGLAIDYDPDIKSKVTKLYDIHNDLPPWAYDDWVCVKDNQFEECRAKDIMTEIERSEEGSWKRLELIRYLGKRFRRKETAEFLIDLAKKHKIPPWKAREEISAKDPDSTAYAIFRSLADMGRLATGTLRSEHEAAMKNKDMTKWCTDPSLDNCEPPYLITQIPSLLETIYTENSRPH